MPKLYRLPRFHSNLVYHRPSNLSNIEALRNIYPNLYYEDEVKPEEDSNETSCFSNYSYTENLRINAESSVNQAKNTFNAIPHESIPLTSNGTSATTRTTEDFSRRLCDIEDYGSETRDFIISCLESSICQNTVPVQTSQPSCSSNEPSVDLPIDDQAQMKASEPESASENVPPRPITMESSLRAEKPAETPPKSPTKSRLPLLLKDQVRKDCSNYSGRDFSPPRSFKKQPPTPIRIIDNKVSTPKTVSKTKTKWLSDNKMQFTKKMTTYNFRQYDINGNKNFKNVSHDFFGYTP